MTPVKPNAGPLAGSTSVIITGTSLNGATACLFGGTPATSFVVNSSTQITAVAPAEAAGTIDITVTTPVERPPVYARIITPSRRRRW